MLVKELAGGEIVGDIVDVYPQPIGNYPVTLGYDHINALVGKEIPEDTVKSILAFARNGDRGRKRRRIVVDGSDLSG